MILAGVLLSYLTQILRRDLWLMLKAVVAPSVADLFRFCVQIASDDCCIVAPIVLRQWEVVAHPGDLIGIHRLMHQWCRASTVGTLEVLKFYDRDLRPRWWL